MRTNLNLIVTDGLAGSWTGTNAAQRFHVTATRADGSTEAYTAIGGSSCDHTLAAMDLAGLGGVVRVLPITEDKVAA